MLRVVLVSAAGFRVLPKGGQPKIPLGGADSTCKDHRSGSDRLSVRELKRLAEHMEDEEDEPEMVHSTERKNLAHF